MTFQPNAGLYFWKKLNPIYNIRDHPEPIYCSHENKKTNLSNQQCPFYHQC